MTLEQIIIKILESIFTLVGENIHVVLYLCSILLGWAGAWFINETTYKVHLLDYPNERSSHETTTPKGGGIGILAAFVLAAALLNISTTFVFSVILITLVSFYSDSHDLSAGFRLGIHFVAAFLLTLPFIYNAAISSIAAHHIYWALLLWALLYIFFIVTTANFYNFMDGINGMAGVTGMIGFGLIALYYNQFLHIYPAPASKFIILDVCILFSCLGFLPFNMHRARVFLGDVGSILLGFVFAGLIVRLSVSFLDFTCMASFLFLYYADGFTTLWVRFRDREELTKPHRRHFYQLLANELQLAHWKVTVLYGALQFIIGISVIFARRYGLFIVLLQLTLYFIIFTLISFHFRRKLISV